MSIELDSCEIRVLGALIEKEFVTPENYPMTLNSLRTACNQKSSREPVVEFDEETVEQTVSKLRGKGWVMLRSGTGSRVLKYEHLLPSFFDLDKKQTALLCVLMLRGEQTTGELKTRTTRMYLFESNAQVEEVLTGLADRSIPLVIKLPRVTGQKERRYTHLLSGEPETKQDLQAVEPGTIEQIANIERPEPAPDLAEKVEALEKELTALKIDFEEFKKQFE